MAAEAIPALSSLAGDKLSEKGWSTASELTQLAGSEAGKRIRASNQNLGGVQQNVADFISQRGNEMLAHKFLGNGNRNLGAGNRNLGAGNRILGKKSFSSLEDGANFA